MVSGSARIELHQKHLYKPQLALSFIPNAASTFPFAQFCLSQLSTMISRFVFSLATTLLLSGATSIALTAKGKAVTVNSPLDPNVSLSFKEVRGIHAFV